MFKFTEIRDFDRNNLHLRQTLAELLAAVFPHSYRDSAAEEAEKLLGQERIALAALDGDALVGFIGAIPQYGITGWELHPHAVQEGYRGHGIGSMLIRALEEEAGARGGITIYLGTDDEFLRHHCQIMTCISTCTRKSPASATSAGIRTSFIRKTGTTSSALSRMPTELENRIS